ncbi:hypothetical protein [Xenorhabdus hominickii]|uniref:Uncharacterized protein n=1 Tax=Xenorhabdus hominickii TaxID=351679 RepID=A0A2G0PW86_XENHO|nr:hypothetical protein [Xenorhabdus hominickii]AOM39197.1 hypothetical protein A9255_00335 [Xenorhabdus hominickii]PHM51244.1 hypothetical protein Xhom_04955 [Xenorhabdus hominickii]
MTAHNYIKRLELLKTQIEASLSYIEHVRLLKGEADADAVAENDLKSLLSYHSRKVEESQRQQHGRVISLDGAPPLPVDNYFEKTSFVSSCISCAKDEGVKFREQSILKRTQCSEKYPVTWIIQLGAKEPGSVV